MRFVCNPVLIWALCVYYPLRMSLYESYCYVTTAECGGGVLQIRKVSTNLSRTTSLTTGIEQFIDHGLFLIRSMRTGHGQDDSAPSVCFSNVGRDTLSGKIPEGRNIIWGQMSQLPWYCLLWNYKGNLTGNDNSGKLSSSSSSSSSSWWNKLLIQFPLQM